MSLIKATSKRRSLGQGMTEYIIIVALIAIAAIGVFNFFGKTVRNQGAAMAQGLAGEDTKSTTDSKAAGTAAAGASTSGNTARSLKDFGTDSGSK
jgi:Flp pilus assembly pilin Flp